MTKARLLEPGADTIPFLSNSSPDHREAKTIARYRTSCTVRGRNTYVRTLDLYFSEKNELEQVFHQMKGDVGMHNAKNRRNKSKMIVQSCITPPYIIQVQGLHMIILYIIML